MDPRLAAVTPAIELKGLTKKYGDRYAVSRLDLTVNRGEVFGLLGPNGAGKTTTILMMLGLTEPTSGTARVCGLDPVRSPLQVKRRVGYMPDDVGFYEDRTASDNLMFTARLNRIPTEEAAERISALLDKVGLAEASQRKVGTFSRGMRQRLGIADVLIKRPEIVILDEPTLGIDPEGVRELLEMISGLSRQEGITVLLSSHHLHQVQQVCDRVGLFVQGKLIACGDIAELSRTLDADGTVTVDMELTTWTEALREELLALNGVLRVDRELNADNSSVSNLQIICNTDLTPSIARKVVESGAELLSIKKRHYGLDDIYHRYFEGGERYGA